MKKFLVMFLAACCCCVFAGEFDFTIAKGLKGWRPNTGKSSFDPVNKVSGTGSIKLVGNSTIFKKITLEPNTEYEVTVFIKAENVKGGKYRGVLLRLTDENKFFAVSGDPKRLPRQGSFDWEKCTATFNSSIFSKSEIRVMPALTCDGTAWFADLKIEKKK